jgi:hypothetical protein
MKRQRENAPAANGRASTANDSQGSNTQPKQPQVKPIWRDFRKIHPAAAIFNEKTTDDDLKKLAADIKAEGLKARIREREVAGEKGVRYVIDGISRLDAMEQVLDWQIINERGEWIGALEGNVELRFGRTHEQIAREVISLNAKRRHNTKEDLAAAIAEALKLERVTKGKGISHIDDEKKPRPRGRPRDEYKEEVVKEAAKHNISKPTVEKALARQPDRPKIEKPKSKEPEPTNTFRGREVTQKMADEEVERWIAKQIRRAPQCKVLIYRALITNVIGAFYKDDIVAPEKVKYFDGTEFTLDELLQAKTRLRLKTDEREKLQPVKSYDITEAAGHATKKSAPKKLAAKKKKVWVPKLSAQGERMLDNLLRGLGR